MMEQTSEPAHSTVLTRMWDGADPTESDILLRNTVLSVTLAALTECELMLREAIQYLMTPCDPQVRKLGYLKELIATEARAHRCREAWRPHQEQTKSVILKAITLTTARDHAVVLGGGLIFDIPLQELASSFHEVDLVDVCFSRQTRAAAQKFPNTALIEFDLTGVVGRLSNNETQIEVGLTPDPERRMMLERLQAANLVVSANTLSQLPIIPLRVLHRRNDGGGNTSLDHVGQSLLRDHLKLLEGCAGTVCLITEVERLTCRDDVVLDQESALFGLELNLGGETWTWDIAPHSEVYPDRDIRLTIRSAAGKVSQLLKA